MWWGNVQRAVEVQPRSLVRVAADAWRGNCARCRLLHRCSARTQRRLRNSSPPERSGARQRSRYASLTLCGQAAPLSCSLPELRVPRGETAGAAFLLDGVTVQARLPRLPGRHASGRLPSRWCLFAGCAIGPSQALSCHTRRATETYLWTWTGPLCRATASVLLEPTVRAQPRPAALCPTSLVSCCSSTPLSATGCGKSTLLRCLCGQRNVNNGRLVVGTNVQARLCSSAMQLCL